MAMLIYLAAGRRQKNCAGVDLWLIFGVRYAGDMEEDLMALVPFEKAKRDGQQAAEQPVVGLTKDITEGIEASSERAARQEASGGVEAEGPAGGDDGDNSNEAQIRAALGELTKPDIQDRLRRLQMKVTGWRSFPSQDTCIEDCCPHMWVFQGRKIIEFTDSIVDRSRGACLTATVPLCRLKR